MAGAEGCGGQGRGRTVDHGKFQMGAQNANMSLQSYTVSVGVSEVLR
jgi:hypothetical protein